MSGLLLHRRTSGRNGCSLHLRSRLLTGPLKLWIWSSSESTSRSCSASDSIFPEKSGPPRTISLPAATSAGSRSAPRSEEHTSELQSPDHLVCRLLLEKKKKKSKIHIVNC